MDMGNLNGASPHINHESWAAAEVFKHVPIYGVSGASVCDVSDVDDSGTITRERAWYASQAGLVTQRLVTRIMARIAYSAASTAATSIPACAHDGSWQVQWRCPHRKVSWPSPDHPVVHVQIGR